MSRRKCLPLKCISSLVTTLLHYTGIIYTVAPDSALYSDLKPNSSGERSGTERVMWTAETLLVFKWREESLRTCVAASKLFGWDSARQKMIVFLIIIDGKNVSLSIPGGSFQARDEWRQSSQIPMPENLTMCCLIIMKMKTQLKKTAYEWTILWPKSVCDINKPSWSLAKFSPMAHIIQLKLNMAARRFTPVLYFIEHYMQSPHHTCILQRSVLHYHLF